MACYILIGINSTGVVTCAALRCGMAGMAGKKNPADRLSEIPASRDAANRSSPHSRQTKRDTMPYTIQRTLIARRQCQRYPGNTIYRCGKPHACNHPLCAGFKFPQLREIAHRTCNRSFISFSQQRTSLVTTNINMTTRLLPSKCSRYK